MWRGYVASQYESIKKLNEATEKYLRNKMEFGLRILNTLISVIKTFYVLNFKFHLKY